LERQGDHPVAAASFREIEGSVGGREQVALGDPSCESVGWLHAGDAHGYRDHELLSVPHGPHAFHGTPDPLSQRAAVVEGRLLRDRDELVAAVTRKDILLANGVAQLRCDRLDRLVPGEMARFVVHVLVRESRIARCASFI
jgi:hypothetical protein